MTVSRISDKQLGKIAQKNHELFRQVLKGSLSASQVIRDLKDLSKFLSLRFRRRSSFKVSSDSHTRLAFLYAEQNQIFADVKAGKLPFRDTLIALQEVIDGGFKPKTNINASLVHGLFTTPIEQLEMMQKWNKEFALGLSSKDFSEARSQIPKWPKDKLTALVLVPRVKDDLPPKSRPRGMAQRKYKLLKREYLSKTGLQSTLEKIWQIVADNHQKDIQAPSLCFDVSQLRLAKELKYRSGLSWEIINFEANEDLSPKQIGYKKPLANLGVFVAMALHPEFMVQMNGDTIPFTLVPSLHITLIPKESEMKQIMGRLNQSVPALIFDQKNQKLIAKIVVQKGEFEGFSSPELLA